MDQISLCNQALQAAGARTSITSLVEESVEARACNLLLVDLIDEALSKADWRFARKALTLTLFKQVPDGVSPVPWDPQWPEPPFRYSYLYPSDCIQMQMVEAQGVRGGQPSVPIFGENTVYGQRAALDRWKLSTDTDDDDLPVQVILSNAYQALGVYTKRVVEPAQWASNFQQLMVFVLAARLTIPLGGDKNLAKMNLEVANQKLRDAQASDGNEGLTIHQIEPDWIGTRAPGWGPALGFPTNLPSLFQLG